MRISCKAEPRPVVFMKRGTSEIKKLRSRYFLRISREAEPRSVVFMKRGTSEIKRAK